MPLLLVPAAITAAKALFVIFILSSAGVFTFARATYNTITSLLAEAMKKDPSLRVVLVDNNDGTYSIHKI